ncbi:outer membrane usher protein [Citrobacter sp. HN-141]|uniref:outer membrane usher protein n=1 Tax=unclassified Citrobacter TaxID=2644389 RepID=UPI0029656990|nr:MULTISPECIES: outer membrane usher protein [unclassified Citrobacter]MDW2643206.1 outer membrane usher protein [Citrobacter sp. HN-141]MDW2652553.1 outer membrane usher protein [Citrobacter sp. HN-120]MDW2695578.1 outer membrane usher protein [Citrobacter sp. HN-144]
MRYSSGPFYLPPLLVGLFWLSDVIADEPAAVAGASTPAPEASTDPEAVEFSSAFLMGDAGSQLDLKRFSRGNPVLPGRYNVNLWLNGKEKLKTAVTFNENGTDYATPCFTRSLLEQMDVNLDSLDIADDEETCYVLSQVLDNSNVRYDPLTQQLDVTIPQIHLISRPPGYVSPSRWDEGVPMAMLSYNSNGWHAENDGSTQDTFYTGLLFGINMGAWRLRSNGAYNWDNDNGGEYSSYDLFIERDIAALQGKLEMGDVRTTSDVLDSVSLDGVHLYHDNQMNPAFNNYVPTIRGVASSNAKITVRQRDRIVTQVTVPPGPYAISDYFAAQNGSDLDVTVEETDGSIHTFSVPFASVAHLLSPGQVDWDFGAGTVDKNQVDETIQVATFSGAYGVNNLFTLYGGAQWAESLYAAGMAGIAMNTLVGAFAMDVTHSSTNVEDEGTLTGQSYSINYSKSFDATDTTFSVTGYRFSSENYLSLNDALSLQNTLDDYADEHDTDQQSAMHAYSRTRNQVQANIYQDITIGEENYGSFYLNGTWSNYWGDDGNTSEYALGYSSSIGRVSYSISVQRSYDSYGEKDDTINLGFSIPLGSSSSVDKPAFSSLSMNTTSDLKGNDNINTTVTGNSSDNRYNYSLNASSSRNKDSEDLTTIGSWLTYNGDRTTGSLSVTEGLNGDEQYSLSASGGVLLHSGGLTLASGYLSSDTTMALVRAVGAKGASGTSGNGAVDRFGNLVVTGLSPYRENTVGLDISTMENDVEIGNTTAVVVPTSGALVRIDIETDARKAFMLELVRDDGGFIPLAADVKDDKGASIGTVGQAGIAFVRGTDDNGTLSVVWGASSEERCRVTYSLSSDTAVVGKSPFLANQRCQMSTAKSGVSHAQ